MSATATAAVPGKHIEEGAEITACGVASATFFLMYADAFDQEALRLVPWLIVVRLATCILSPDPAFFIFYFNCLFLK